MWSRRWFAMFLAVCGSGLPAMAWGPFTHVAIGRAVLGLARVRPDSPLAFLQREPERSIFLAASMGPDMTFSVTSFGKTDRTLDLQLHDPKLGRALLTQASESGDRRRMAFALGWMSHVEADRLMCVKGSVIYRNVFELKHETLEKLAGDVPGILKVAIDAIRAKADPWLLTTLPRVDTDRLAWGLKRTLGKQLTQSQAEVATMLSGHAETFADSISTLREICRSLGANRSAFPELESELTESVAGGVARPLPGMEAVEKVVHRYLEQALPEEVELGPGGTSALEVRRSKGLLARLTAGLTRRSRALLAGDGLVARVTRSVLDTTVDAMNSVGIGRERTRRARVLATFLGEMLADRHDWQQVKAAVRAVAEETREPGNPEERYPGPEDDPIEGPP